MKQTTNLIFILLLCWLSSCTFPSGREIELTRKNYFNSTSISYQTMAFYPNPIGKIDTIKAIALFNKNTKSVVGYDFIMQYEGEKISYENGKLQNIDSINKVIEEFRNNDSTFIKSYITDINFIKNGPLSLLQNNDWKKYGDTIINDEKFLDFYRIENDTVVNKNNIYTEQHIIINPKTLLIEVWNRKNYFNDTLNQNIIYRFSDYSFDTNNLTTHIPKDYITKIYVSDKELKLIEPNQKAPNFTTFDLNNSTVNLNDFIGKKVILNFSSVGCGNSHEALKFIEKNNLLQSTNMVYLYISIWDKQKDVEDYFDKVHTPFTVIANSENIAEKYGVSGSPTFIIINEEGNIERVKEGYNNDFLLELK